MKLLLRTGLVVGLLAYTLSASVANLPTNDNRIVGGYFTEMTKVPYVVSVQFNGYPICGGTLIDTDVVITAAHCFEEVDEDTPGYTVRAGSVSYKDGGQLVPVRRILVHHNYSRETLDYDIALLVLAKDLVLSDEVKAAKLATTNATLRTNDRLYVSGWGLDSEFGEMAPKIKQVMVHLLSRQACIASYLNYVDISDHMFCAGHTDGGQDSCQGDSGGPLVSASVNGQYMLYGIVSWGIGCGEASFPGVYTNVTSHREWIKEKVPKLDYMR